jgi:hypothetical protein
MDVDFDFDVEALNARWSDPINIDSWSQMVIKHTRDELEMLTEAPASGVWQLDDSGEVRFLHAQTHRRTVEREDEAFFLRIARPGDYRYEGADLGILLTPGRLLDAGKLTERGKAWVHGLQHHYRAEPIQEAQAPAEIADLGGFKFM